jgi:uncharacterized protein (DUF1800 family)
MRQANSLRAYRRVDASGAAALARTISAILAVLFTIAATNAAARENKRKTPSGADPVSTSGKLKGPLPITQLTEDEAILHALNRLAYGPRPGDVERLRKMGLKKWIDQQLHPDSIDDSELDARLKKYPTVGMSSTQLLREFPRTNQAGEPQGLNWLDIGAEQQRNPHETVGPAVETGNENIDKAQLRLAKVEGPKRIIVELSMAKLDRSVYSERQLEAVMEDFWFNHFNVFANKAEDKWLVTSYVRDAIRPHTMGKFQDLLVATAKSPAMLFFLDNWQSVDPAAFEQSQQETGRRRERYLGIFAQGWPPQPGTFPGSDARLPRPFGRATRQKQGRGLNENYGREVMELHTVGLDAGFTQQDVMEMAECLTGWTIRDPRKDPEYVFRPEFHARGKKFVMGHSFDYGDERDGEEALKMLAKDPHTAKSISTELARRFVSDDPPRSLVERMAKNYGKTSGDIRSLLETMIYSPEFWSRDSYRAKVKTPFEVVASTARALNADISVSLPLVEWVGRMGEPLFLCQPPTGYSDQSETWVNTGALLNRLNFALAFASDHMLGANLDLATMFGKDASQEPRIALFRALDVFLDGQVSAGTRQTLEGRMSDPQIFQRRLDGLPNEVNQGLIAGLVLGAPEFQQR